MTSRLSFVFCAVFIVAAAALRASPVVNFKTYSSASGEYALEVDPSALDGHGPGKYRMTRHGQETWSKTLPFTLYDAVVTNDGVSIGYAYGNSYNGFAPKGGSEAGVGSLHIVVLDAKGGQRLHETFKRQFSRMFHAPPEPVVRGIILQEDLDQFTIRAGLERSESWWSYQYSTGKGLRRFELRKAGPSPALMNWIAAAKPISGTPLVLVEAGGRDDEHNRPGTLFMLVDPEGRSVWSHVVSADYSVLGDEKVEERVRDLTRDSGLVLDATKAGEFELWFATQSQRVRFSVARDETGGGWRVAETARRPHELPAPTEEKPFPGEARPLALLGTFKLGSERAVGPIHDVESFEFDRDGAVGLLRRTPASGVTFVLLDAAGKVIAEVPIPKEINGKPVDSVKAAAVGKGRWVLIASEEDRHGGAWAWWFEIGTMSLSKPFQLADCPEVETVAGTGQRGFVALATRAQRFSSGSEVHGFDAVGKRFLQLVEDHLDTPGSLFSPEDLTVTSSGEVAVLDNIRNVIQFFASDGKYLRSIDIRKSWGRKPNYLSGIVTDFQGGVIVHDFNGTPPFVHMNVDGKVRASLRPRHPNGRLVDPGLGLRVAADGRIWACDGQALLRLDEKGVVDRTLGQDPQPEDLGRIAAVTTDRHGQLYAVDERTGAVHVFDAEGRKVRVCKPGPGDFRERMRWPPLTVADDGSVYLGADERVSSQSGWLHFSPDGTRQGFKDFKIKERQEWHVQPGTGNFLVNVYQSAGLLSPKGKVLKDIARRADRLWLDAIDEASFASDGSFAILSGQSGSYGQDQAITLYDHDGAALRTFVPVQDHVSLIGCNLTHVVLQRGKTIQIYDRLGTPVQQFPLPWEGDGAGAMTLTRDGRELWAVEFSSRTVQRYAMP